MRVARLEIPRRQPPGDLSRYTSQQRRRDVSQRARMIYLTGEYVF